MTRLSHFLLRALASGADHQVALRYAIERNNSYLIRSFQS